MTDPREAHHRNVVDCLYRSVGKGKSMIARKTKGSESSRGFLVACFATFFATSPFSRAMAARFENAEGLGSFTAALMVGVLFCGLALCLSGYALRERRFSTIVLKRCVLLALAAYAVSAGSFAAVSVARWDASVLMLAGFAAGVSTAVLLLYFGARAARPSLSANLVFVALAFGLATLIGELVSLFDDPLAHGAHYVVFAAGVVMTGILAAKDQPLDGGVLSLGGGGAARPFSRLASVAVIPLFGLFVFALFVKPGEASSSPRPQLFGLDEELLLFFFGCLVLLCLGVAKFKTPLYSSVNQMAVPVWIVLVLVLLSFPHEAGGYWLGGLLVVFGTAFVALFAVAVVCTLAGTGELAPVFAFCPALAVYAGGRLAGMWFHAAARGLEDVYVAYQILVVVFLASMIVLIVAFYRMQLVTQMRVATGAHSIPHIVEEACASIAATYGLTPREREVLAFVARGYSATYVADTLVVSGNTVRTHMKNIYRKLGISSREEAIELVDKASMRFDES